MKKVSTTLWGRWCLPSFNKNCNQLLKGALADRDNSLCDGKEVPQTILKKKKDLCPWENPTLLVMLNSYGM